MVRIAAFLTMAVILSTPAAAQNLLTNPFFVGSTSGWDTSPHAVWDGALNFNDSPDGDDGVLRISTSESDAAWQCVAIAPGQRYVFGAAVINDPSAEAQPCAASAWQVDIEWWNGTECQQPLSAMIDDTRIGPDDRTNVLWLEEKQTFTAPAGATRARVVLASSCASRSGATSTLFDDVLFEADEIAKFDFEIHASEGGPGSS